MVSRDKLLDQILGVCVPQRSDTWGKCVTHNVGWGPAAFASGRCWAAVDIAVPVVKALDIVYSEIMSESEVARLAPKGKHPDILMETHAAALHYAARIVAG